MSTSPKVTKKATPEPQVSEQMDFPAAMQAVIDGKKITRLEWLKPEEYGYLAGTLKIKLSDKAFHDWIVSDGDMYGKDWVVKEE